MGFLKWLLDYFSGCAHSRQTFPRTDMADEKRPCYRCCLGCGARIEYTAVRFGK